MKSLADFKRIAVVGAVFERAFPNDINAAGKTAPPEHRKVILRHTNAVAFVSAHQTGTTQPSWFYFPKAERLRFADGIMTVLYDDDTPCMTLKHVRAP